MAWQQIALYIIKIVKWRHFGNPFCFLSFRFCIINAGVLYVYFSSFQQIDEEEYGGTWELTKEGFMTSFALFLVKILNSLCKQLDVLSNQVNLQYKSALSNCLQFKWFEDRMYDLFIWLSASFLALRC